MIFIAGKLHDIAHGETKDRNTGEIIKTHTLEILHKNKGKSEIASVKCDSGVVDQWSKAIGRDITLEVGFYAMKTPQGDIMKGLTMADKLALPTVQRAAVAA
jgi:hypothetical protein